MSSTCNNNLQPFLNIPDSLTLGNGIGDIKGIIDFRIWYKTRKDTNVNLIKSTDINVMNLKYDHLIQNNSDMVYIHYMASVITDHFEPIVINDTKASDQYYKATVNGESTIYELMRENIVVEIPVEWVQNKIIPTKIISE